MDVWRVHAGHFSVSSVTGGWVLYQVKGGESLMTVDVCKHHLDFILILLMPIVLYLFWISVERV